MESEQIWVDEQIKEDRYFAQTGFDKCNSYPNPVMWLSPKVPGLAFFHLFAEA